MSTTRSEAEQAALTSSQFRRPEWLHHVAKFDRDAAAYVRTHNVGALPDWLAKFDEIPVVRATDTTSGHLHLPDLEADEPAPACGYNMSDCNWTDERLSQLRAWRDPCAHCFPDGYLPELGGESK